MPGLNSPEFDDVAATPGRRTTVRFDVPETVLQEPAWAEMRGPHDIHEDPDSPLVATLGASYGVTQLASGWWGLQPVNADLYESHETLPDNPSLLGAVEGEPLRPGDGPSLVTDSGVIGLKDMITPLHVAEHPTFHAPTELPFALTGASPNLVPKNDFFMTVERPAGLTYVSFNTSPVPPPPLPLNLRKLMQEAHVPMDRVAESSVVCDPDTGFLLRWIVPGNPHTKVDYSLAFYFGGSCTSEHLGHFCLRLGGDGTCYLYEEETAEEAAPGAVTWIEREHWEFCNPQATVNVVHVMRIIPHARRFIEFASHIVDKSFSVASHSGAHYGERPNSNRTHLHTMAPDRVAKRAPTARFVTGAGVVRFDVRRDLAVSWQVARLVYNTSTGDTPAGMLIDHPFAAPFGLQDGASGSPNVGVKVASTSAYWKNQTFTGAIRLYDAETKAELGIAGDRYLLPGGKNCLVPVIEFTSADRYHSPYLFNYGLSREKVLQQIDVGEFSGGVLQSVEVTGPSNDMSHETCHLRLHDPLGSLPRLAKRGLFHMLVETEVDGDPNVKSVLFEGYARSPRRRPLAKDEMEFPTQDWAEYEIDGIGMWRRLQAALIFRIEDYSQADLAIDPDAEQKDGTIAPWKLTDVLRKTIGDAGFDEGQIDVPDFPMRLWESTRQEEVEAWRPASGTRDQEYLQTLLQDYLGGYLIWDGNAGARGMWRMKFQPTFSTPLWSFVLGPVAGMEGKLAHSLRSYPPNTSPIFRVEGRESLQTWVEPPEANAVCVVGAGPLKENPGVQTVARSWKVNKTAIDWPAFGSHADPEDPDFYGGFFEPIIEADFSLADQDQGQRAAAWRATRLFDFACRARDMAQWTGHLVLVTDPADSHQTRPRPLRYGDPVLIAGSPYLITSATATAEHDHMHLGEFQAQRWNAPSLIGQQRFAEALRQGLSGSPRGDGLTMGRCVVCGQVVETDDYFLAATGSVTHGGECCRAFREAR